MMISCRVSIWVGTALYGLWYVIFFVEIGKVEMIFYRIGTVPRSRYRVGSKKVPYRPVHTEMQHRMIFCIGSS
jgi:hypothetical protein